MSKRLKVVGLIIFGFVILIICFLSIQYVIHSNGNNADADYVSIDKIEDVYKESWENIHDTIEKECLAEGIWAIKLEVQDVGTIDEYEVVNEEVIENDGVSEENIEKTILYDEPIEEDSIRDEEAYLDDEIIEYMGDEYVDKMIQEHRDEIADEDIIFGLSIADRIDSNMVYSYMEDGLTDKERGEISDYLQSILTEVEYAKLKELFHKYNYILEYGIW